MMSYSGSAYQQLSAQAVSSQIPVYPARDYGLVEENRQKTFYGKEAVTGTFAETLLNQAYFSDKNINIVQNAIRYEVWKQTGQKVSKQSTTELIIVMRSIYFQHGKNLPDDIPEQISDLNELVVQAVIPKILSNLTQYTAYLEKINGPLDPIPRSIDTSTTGLKNNRSVTSTF